MSVAGNALRVNDTQHLRSQGEVLAHDVPDALAQRDPTGCGLGLEPLVIGAIDPAVNQLPESVHRSPSERRVRGRASKDDAQQTAIQVSSRVLCESGLGG